MTVSSNYSAYSATSSSGTSSSKQADRPSFEEMAQQLLSSIDTNNSGAIDKAEFSAAAKALASNSSSNSNSSTTDAFNKLDSNSDGSLSTDELMSALKNMKPPQGQYGSMPPPPPPPSDSSSTSSESSSSTSASNKLFSALDTNKDGSISADELTALFSGSTSKNSVTSATSASSTTSSSQTDATAKQISNDWLQKLLSYYSNNTASQSSTSLLSVSA